MFERLQKFNRIIVTGPQRSGTRICSQMIARELGYQHIDERVFNVEDTVLFKKCLLNAQYVIHCPAMCFAIDEFCPYNAAVVMMIRNRDDIIASQRRIGWQYEEHELRKYGEKEGPICDVKYRKWQQQKTMIKNHFEIEYESLKESPMWVEKEKRKQFMYNQTMIIS